MLAIEKSRHLLPLALQGYETWRLTFFAMALVGVFDSQITGGKRYDLATAGRRMAQMVAGKGGALAWIDLPFEALEREAA